MHADPNSMALGAAEPMKTELVSGPLVAGDELGLRIRVEHDGNLEEFRVRIYAPGLYDYAPYVEAVRKAIARVLAEHEAELEAMFASMPQDAGQNVGHLPQNGPDRSTNLG